MTAHSRCRVVFDTEVNPDWTPILSAAPTELILTEPLPEVCSEHGLPAGGIHSFTVHSTGPLSELPTGRALLRSLAPGRRIPAESRIRFECPACEYCLSEVVRYRRRAMPAMSAVPLTIAAVVVARLFELEWLYIPLGFAVVPGCLPIALLVAVLSWSRSGYFADVWMNETADRLIISAHPNFATAVERSRTGGASGVPEA